MQKIILASQSPRRKQLLELAEINFVVIAVDTDETFPEGLSFSEAAIHIARNKAIAVQKLHGSSAVIAADTVVICDNLLIGKPKDRDEAIKILQSLSGNSHKVITGVVIRFGKKNIEFSETTEVNFNQLSLDQITFYVDKYKPYDKAGAYAIQEWIGAVGIKSINGDFYNVMGLPVNKVYEALKTLQLLRYFKSLKRLFLINNH